VYLRLVRTIGSLGPDSVFAMSYDFCAEGGVYEAMESGVVECRSRRDIGWNGVVDCSGDGALLRDDTLR